MPTCKDCIHYKVCDDYMQQQVETNGVKCDYFKDCVENNKDEAEDLLMLAIRGEILRLNEEKSKRRQQQIREFISKSYEQLIEIRGTR